MHRLELLPLALQPFHHVTVVRRPAPEAETEATAEIPLMQELEVVSGVHSRGLADLIKH
jgi:hypothetical protein